MDLIGLALSGGGIRSATFSLGILQGLADKGLLRHVDYISTVSGGGYIGSWLVSWIHRSTRDGQFTARAALEQVLANLRSDQKKPRDPALEPIHYLRRYSNYLTPNVSFFSADTWTLAAIWSRNTLLNFVIVVCGIATLLLLPRFGGFLLHNAPLVVSSESPAERFEFWIAAGALFASIFTMAVNLGNIAKQRSGFASHRGVQLLVVIPLLIAAGALSEWMYRAPSLFRQNWLLGPTIGFGIAFLVVALTADFPGCFVRQNQAKFPNAPLGFIGYLFAVIAAMLSGVVTAALLHGLALLFDSIPEYDWRPWAFITLGPPLVLLILALGMVLLIGLMGHDIPDSSREWLGRLRAWTMIYGAVWLLFTGISIYGPYVLYWAGSTAALSLGGVWSATSIGGLFAGKSGKTKGVTVEGQPDFKRAFLEILSTVAPFVFIAGFAMIVALGIHELVSPRTPAAAPAAQPRTVTIDSKPDKISLTVGEKPKPTTYFDWRKDRYHMDLHNASPGVWSPFDLDFYNLGSLFLLVTLGGLILAWRVDINDFSMHHFYKNRLVRCYLGASRPKRKPDPFIGFDDQDDIPLRDFAAVVDNDVVRDNFARSDYCGPYPIINGALNLAGGTALAWQERKAAPFIFTPLFCGYNKPEVDKEAGNPRPIPGVSKNGYAPTSRYAYDKGIKVGTAMGISGAAANPNSGYHTSPAVAFLLTLFNVRLGWWLGNPARFGKADNPGPAFGLPYLAVELFGLANTDKAYVNISDGGHFENLGIYELVRRRCRYIVSCDGEQDAGMKFEGLANAIRKCRTDFGVQIEIDVEQLRKKDGFSPAHCVVGKIKYPDDQRPAYLLYLKSSVTGNEETDVLQYKSKHPEFPHQSTGDQWFDESQFESYRKLGLHVADSAFSSIPQPLTTSFANAADYAAAKAGLFQELWDLLYPPSEAIQKSFTHHTDAYTKLIDAIAGKSDFDYLDSMIYSEWTTLTAPPDPSVKRPARYLCTSFIQLMENVYLDLNLEDPKQRNHPHNDGWLRLFRKWVVTDAFRDTWVVASTTYGKRFQKFYADLLAGEVARVEGAWVPASDPTALIPRLNAVRILMDTGMNIAGQVTANDVHYQMRDLAYNGTDVTFGVLFQSGDAVQKFRMRLDEKEKRAMVTKLDANMPFFLLKKN